MNTIDLNEPAPPLPKVAPVAVATPSANTETAASSAPSIPSPAPSTNLIQPMVEPTPKPPQPQSVPFSLAPSNQNIPSSEGPGTVPSKPAPPATNTASQIEISVSEPHKIGEGMSSYMVYTVSTKTTLPYFRRQSLSVHRRFSDFLGLHDKLAEKHAALGRIVPPPPSKSMVGTAKIKFGGGKSTGEESSAGSSGSGEFIEKRRAALERYLTRNAEHPIICADPDFREFLELDTELPRSTSTSALSGAGVKRMFSFVSDTVNKMTFKMDETDTVGAV